MQDADQRKLDELERLLNDPDVPMQPSRVWELASEISGGPAAGWTQPRVTR